MKISINYGTQEDSVTSRTHFRSPGFFLLLQEQYHFLYACAQHQINVERNITDPDENVYMTHDPAMEDVYMIHDPAEKNLYGNLDTKINNDVKSGGAIQRKMITSTGTSTLPSTIIQKREQTPPELETPTGIWTPC